MSTRNFPFPVAGNGLQGVTIPGCPETYQEDETLRSQFQGRGQGRRGEESEQRGDRHQKVRFIREGDVLALPAGVTHWIYNRGQSDLVLVSVLYTANEENQLDEKFRVRTLQSNQSRPFDYFLTVKLEPFWILQRTSFDIFLCN